MNYQLSLLIFGLFVFEGCSTPSSNIKRDNRLTIYEAASKGDSQAVAGLLNESGKISDFDRFDLLTASLFNGCNPEVVKTVLIHDGSLFPERLTQDDENVFDKLSTGWKRYGNSRRPPINKPGARLVNLASSSFCDEALKLITKSVSKDDFAFGISRNFEPVQYGWDLSRKHDKKSYPSFTETTLRLANTQSLEALNSPNVISTLTFTKQKLNEFCSKQGSIPCQALDSFAAMGNKIKSQVDELAYEQSDAGQLETIINDACHNYREYKTRLALIREENEKGKISGFVNKYNLKVWGDQAYDFKKQYDALNAERQRREKTKRNVHDEYQCEP